MDARGLSNHGNGFLGFAVGTMETQAFLRRQGRQPFIPNRADEILKVLNIKENRSHYAVRCQVRHPDTHVTRFTYLLIKGNPDEDMLLRELERRKTWENALEPDGNWNLLYILLGGLALAACVTMCVSESSGCCRDVVSFIFPVWVLLWRHFVFSSILSSVSAVGNEPECLFSSAGAAV